MSLVELALVAGIVSMLAITAASSYHGTVIRATRVEASGMMRSMNASIEEFIMSQSPSMPISPVCGGTPCRHTVQSARINYDPNQFFACPNIFNGDPYHDDLPLPVDSNYCASTRIQYWMELIRDDATGQYEVTMASYYGYDGGDAYGNPNFPSAACPNAMCLDVLVTDRDGEIELLCDAASGQCHFP